MPDLPERGWTALAEKTVPNGTVECVAAGADLRVVPKRGCFVQAIAANTQNVYVGPSNVSSTTGIELAAGDMVFLPLNPPDIFCTAGFAGQKLHIVAI